MRIVSTVFVAYLTLVASTDVVAADYLGYFKRAGVEVTEVVGETGSSIGNGVESKAAYGYTPETAFEGHYVGVFLIKNGALVETIDLLPSWAPMALIKNFTFTESKGPWPDIAEYNSAVCVV